MQQFFTIDDLITKTGLSKAKLRYLEARFPAYIQKRLFDPEGKFYSPGQIKIFQELNRKMESNRLPPGSLKQGKVITIASGKGGVGKTSLSIALSLIAASSGIRTLLMDGDLGMANSHALLKIKPQKDISHLFSEGIPLRDIVTRTHFGLNFLPGANGMADIANLDPRSLDTLTSHIKSLVNDFDWIMIDAPAGIGPAVLSWIFASQAIIVVTTPSPAALLDAYGLIKTAYLKNYQNPIYILLNQVQSQNQGLQVFQHLQECVSRFLKKSLNYLGSVRKDTKLESMLLDEDKSWIYTPSLTIVQLKKIANQLLNEIIPGPKGKRSAL